MNTLATNLDARRQTVMLALALGVPTAIGLLSGLATADSVQTWYPSLSKPGFTPPDWLFGPVWTALYLMMG